MYGYLARSISVDVYLQTNNWFDILSQILAMSAMKEQILNLLEQSDSVYVGKPSIQSIFVDVS